MWDCIHVTGSASWALLCWVNIQFFVDNQGFEPRSTRGEIHHPVRSISRPCWTKRSNTWLVYRRMCPPSFGHIARSSNFTPRERKTSSLGKRRGTSWRSYLIFWYFLIYMTLYYVMNLYWRSWWVFPERVFSQDKNICVSFLLCLSIFQWSYCIWLWCYDAKCFNM